MDDDLHPSLGPRLPARSSYHTHLHPEDFDVDWPPFYDRFDQLTADLRRLSHCELNVPYGPDPYQLLDIYYPWRAASGCPVLLFFHGGAFREGHPAHYGFVGKPFLDRGVIFASGGYRLAPDHSFADSAADAVQAISWLYREIAGRRGDPQRIYLSGHSAGGALTAHLSLRSDWQEPALLPVDVIRGSIPISTPYHASAEEDSMRVDHVPGHTIVAFGSSELNRKNSDVGLFAREGAMIGDLIAGAGGSVEIIALDGVTHPETALALADENSELFRAAERMICHEQR